MDISCECMRRRACEAVTPAGPTNRLKKSSKVKVSAKFQPKNPCQDAALQSLTPNLTPEPRAWIVDMFAMLTPVPMPPTDPRGVEGRRELAHQERVPQAGDPVAPRQEPWERGGRRSVQENHASSRGMPPTLNPLCFAARKPCPTPHTWPVHLPCTMHPTPCTVHRGRSVFPSFAANSSTKPALSI